MHPYIPHTDRDIQVMLEKIGIASIDALFEDIPKEALLSDDLNLPQTHSEQKILKKMAAISRENTDTEQWLRFTGGGLYDHLIPTIIPALLSRSEFSTAYTPYQPEISQGTLQAIFEYQTMISELTGLPVANASHYDGATAMAEAAFMACGSTRRQTVLVADTVYPEYLKVLKTYLTYKDLSLEVLPSVDGRVPRATVEAALTKDVAGYITTTPNRYGILEDLNGLADLLHSNKSLFIISANPMSLALYKSPGEWGADIGVGDGQVFGNPISYGGPSLGYIACTEKLMRKIPGRIVGQTLDLDGKRGYVLTLQAREQHIRREKATSNITSNQALNALAATIYLSLLGYKGIKTVADRGRINAHYLRDKLTAIEGVHGSFSAPFYNEFLIEVENADKIFDALEDYMIVPGLKVDDRHILITSTEIHEKADLDALVGAFKEVL